MFFFIVIKSVFCKIMNMLNLLCTTEVFTVVLQNKIVRHSFHSTFIYSILNRDCFDPKKKERAKKQVCQNPYTWHTIPRIPQSKNFAKNHMIIRPV